jgi:uncharacterized protein (UPF0210 family)
MPRRMICSGLWSRLLRAAVAQCLALLACSALFAALARGAEKPKVRAVTAFVRLDRARYPEQIAETLAILRKAKASLDQAGYEVQTLRITPQPFPELTRGLSREEVLAFYHEYAALVKKEAFLSAIGPAMMTDSDDPRQAELFAEVLQQNPELDGSLMVAGDDGVHWNAVRAAARVMKFLADRTPHSQGNFNFAATALVPQHTPFYPGSYHLGPGRQFAVAVQSASIVEEAFAGVHDPAAAEKALSRLMSQHARALEALCRRIEKETGWTYMGLDLSTAPLKEVSIGAAVEKFTGAKFGSSGTMTAAALITRVLREIPVKHAGYSGLMLPVLEDSRLAERWSEGTLTLDSLLAYSAVCGTGLDTIPLPGDITVERLEQIIGDMATLAVKLHKPLSARLLPVTGKKPGERTEFDDPFLVNAVIQPLP